MFLLEMQTDFSVTHDKCVEIFLEATDCNINTLSCSICKQVFPRDNTFIALETRLDILICFFKYNNIYHVRNKTSDLFGGKGSREFQFPLSYICLLLPFLLVRKPCAILPSQAFIVCSRLKLSKKKPIPTVKMALKSNGWLMIHHL